MPIETPSSAPPENPERRSPAGEPPIRALVLEALARGRTVRLGFGGGSMSPLLAPGDSIRVGPIRGAPRRGDIVLYLSGDVFVAHRVLRAPRGGAPDAYLVKGDFTEKGAESLPRDRILGLVLARERRGRRLDLRSGAQRAFGLLASAASPWAVRSGLLLPRPVRRALKTALFLLAGVRG
jgi:hypothetical protein